MKLTTFLLIAFCLQVAASTHAQSVTLSVKNAPLKKVFIEIQKQTGLNILVKESLLEKAEKVTLDVHNMPVNDVLSLCMKNQALNSSIEGGVIVVKEKLPEILSSPDTSKSPAELHIAGRVLNEKGEGMVAATVKVKGNDYVASTGSNGGFSMVMYTKKVVLIVSYVGYKTKEISLSSSDMNMIVQMEQAVDELKEMTLVSTGYQQLPKERSTGSFEIVTNKQLNQITSTNIIRRLEGNTTAINYNNQLRSSSSGDPTKKTATEDMTIRGSNGLITGVNRGNQPLVVVDGFPVDERSVTLDNYLGERDFVGNINPNDVENITILKDAAAASIWGSRSANGVIVITTKRGKLNQPMRIDFNANVTGAQKPDLFYMKRTSTSNFIGVQKFLYQNGYYDGDLSYSQYGEYGYPAIAVPEVVEVLEAQKAGTITPAEADARLAEMGKYDVRNDFTKYILRKPVYQQYSLAVSGGSGNISYRLSAGYDYNRNNTVASNDNRLTLSSAVNIAPIKNLNIQTTITYNKTNKFDQSSAAYIGESVSSVAGGKTLFFPYTRLADDNGNPLSVIRQLRPSYVDTVGSGHLLDWNYVPLKDIKDGGLNNQQDGLVINIGANYKITNAFSASASYNYQRSISKASNLSTADSYFSRDIINRYTSPSTDVNPYHLSIPLGGLNRVSDNNLTSQTFRGQLNFDKSWGGVHEVNAIAGAEVTSSDASYIFNQYWGYNDETKTYNNQMDLVTPVPTYWYQGTGLIPMETYFSDNNHRTTAQFINAAYTYDKRYTISGSLRKDASNVFGATTNQRFSPFYSLGARWNINNEAFYNIAWLPTLQLRATYGLNGNVNYSVAAAPIISYSTTNGPNGLQYARSANTANSQLRPEKSYMLNLGIDFAFVNNRIWGSIEYYHKNNKDLIAPANIDPTTGFPVAENINSANMKAHGMDIRISSINIRKGAFRWTTDLMFSNNRTIVTKLLANTNQINYTVVSAPDLVNVEGRDINSLFAYKWAGLSNTGEAQSYIGKTPTSDYYGVAFSPFTDTGSAVVFKGSSTPVNSGSLRNSFTYKGFTISANLLFKLGYYFRRPDVLSYQNIYRGYAYISQEFDRRWQKPGDELTTNVPALMYPNPSSEGFYQYADINVLRADHIRLQEVNLAYSFNKTIKGFKSLTVYGNLQNLGIIWRANKQGYDPDTYDTPRPLTYGIGVNASF